MKKSLSFKLTAIFVTAVFFAFAFFMIVLSSMITKYSISAKADKKAAAADAVIENISLYSYITNDYDLADELDKYGGEMSDSLLRISAICKSDIYIVNMSGKIVASSVKEKNGSIMMTAEQLFSVIQSVSDESVGDMFGFFGSPRDNSYYPVVLKDGEQNPQFKGAVILSSDESSDPALTSGIITSLSALALWLLLAVFILIGFTVRKYLRPLNEISRVAKECEKGNFDERIKVTGSDEISELALSINGMLETLSLSEKQRRNFIASVSHDLRTPMTTISGFVDGILDGTIPPEKKDDYLGIISIETKRLTRLVNTLLSVASTSLSSAKPVMVPFNLSEKARQILISFEKRIDQKKIEVEFIGEEDVFALAEPDSIHQVIYNLCDNAVKFVNEGGKLTLAIEEKDGKASVRIRNTGEGITAEELPHIFESFYKTDSSRSKDKHGVGLGLYIVKTVINNHGETVNCRSVPGEYTEFSFNLKLADKNK